MIVRTARELGATLRDVRLRRGWTQAELAERIGMSRQWVISVERGKATTEIGSVLRAIEVLGVAIDIVPAAPTHGTIDLDALLGGDR